MRAFPMCELGLEGCELWASEVDHKKPLMDGGDPWAWENLQSACHPCHVVKTTEEQHRISWV
jgi:5-methylcytosine-specific restriction endonuclease McrA